MVNDNFRALRQRPEVIKIFEALGLLSARLVGGCVRDAFLGIQSPDLDIAVAASPQQVIEILEKQKIKVIPTGIDFGTVTAVINHQHYEITSLREDIQTDGRHAVVSFGQDWLKDAKRRDFTINALYLDSQGNLYDFFNGLDDLKAGKIVFIGEPSQRIQEDYLRILRYYRFMAYFGKEEPSSVPALTNLRLGLKQLSVERIQSELLKLIIAPFPEKALKLMVDDKIFETLYESSVCLEGFFKLLKLERTLEISPSSTRRIFALFYEAINYSSSFWETHFRFSSQKKDFLNNMEKCLKVTDKRWVLYKRGYSFFQDWCLLRFALLEEFSCCPLAILQNDLQWASSYPVLKFPLTGKDLLKQGLSAGPEIGKILSRCEQWWIENDFKPSTEECLEYCIDLKMKTENE